MEEQKNHREVVREEFQRVAGTFGERTAGRFIHMDVVTFARARPGETVLEVGAGTGNFLALFREVASRLIAVDLTPAMLDAARSANPGMLMLVADGELLPIAGGSVDLAATAQAIHHVPDPIPFLRELARVAGDSGRVLVVDQVSSEDPAEADVLNRLEVLRDPSHAQSRPPSAYRGFIEQIGLEIIDERIAERWESFSRWMSPNEFPAERVEAVRKFVTKHGSESGLQFQPDGDDYTYLRRRIMLLASRS